MAPLHPLVAVKWYRTVFLKEACASESPVQNVHSSGFTTDPLNQNLTEIRFNEFPGYLDSLISKASNFITCYVAAPWVLYRAFWGQCRHECVGYCYHIKRRFPSREKVAKVVGQKEPRQDFFCMMKGENNFVCKSLWSRGDVEWVLSSSLDISTLLDLPFWCWGRGILLSGVTGMCFDAYTVHRGYIWSGVFSTKYLSRGSLLSKYFILVTGRK